VGNQRHREQNLAHVHVHKAHITDSIAAKETKGQVQFKAVDFRSSESLRIEHIMRSNLIEFTAQVGQHNSPTSVLDALDIAIAEDISLMVLGAKRFAVNLSDRNELKVGESVFIHRSVPEGWWDAYFDLSKKAYAPILMMARHCLAPFTWSECLRCSSPSV
jgi:hypothetical protein